MCNTRDQVMVAQVTHMYGCGRFSLTLEVYMSLDSIYTKGESNLATPG